METVKTCTPCCSKIVNKETALDEKNPFNVTVGYTTLNVSASEGRGFTPEGRDFTPEGRDFTPEGRGFTSVDLIKCLQIAERQEGFHPSRCNNPKDAQLPKSCASDIMDINGFSEDQLDELINDMCLCRLGLRTCQEMS